MKLKDLQVGDWVTISIFGEMKLYIVSLDDDNIVVSSPVFLNTSTLKMGLFRDNDITLIGKSKPNFWYKWFKKTGFPHPYKMIPIKKWQMMAIEEWIK